MSEKPPYVSQDSNGPKNSGFVCLAKLGPLETNPLKKHVFLSFNGDIFGGLKLGKPLPEDEQSPLESLQLEVQGSQAKPSCPTVNWELFRIPNQKIP